MKLFCFGLGYAASVIAQNWQDQGNSFCGTHQTSHDEDPSCFVFSSTQLMDADGIAALEDADAVLISIPPNGMGDPVFRYYKEIMAASKNLRWIGYLSTTAVYGDQQCRDVNETSPTPSTSPRALMRLLAEQQWLNTKLPVHIFRLSGIYGLGRSSITRAKKGAPIIEKPGHLFNRIHVDDIAQAIITSIHKPTSHEIYNLSDDMPAPAEEVLRFAYQQLGLTPMHVIPFAKAELSPMALEFYSECKRVNADKIKQTLGIEWVYPTYREGLLAEL